MKTENELIAHISYKISAYIKGFNRQPDTILMNKADYETIKNNQLIQGFEIHFNHIPLPIIYKR